MSSTNIGTMDCPTCGRPVQLVRRRYMEHGDPHKLLRCPMSKQPVTDEHLEDWAREKLARTVANLAWQLRDEDPKRVTSYLRHLKHDELVNLTIVALAAIDTDQSIEQMFSWVTELSA